MTVQSWWPLYSWLYNWLEDVRLESITADAQKGGWEANLTVLQDTDRIEKWQTVELMFRLYSQGWDADLRTGLIGHALPTGIDFDFLSSGARFSIATSNRFLEGMSVQGIGFRDQSEATPPYSEHDILNMRLGHIVEHILERHCNISIWTNPEGWVDTSDIDTTNSTRVNRYNWHATDNAWSALQNLARNEFYYLWFSPDNAIHYQPHPMFGAVLPDPVMDFTGDFCSGRPTVTQRSVKQVSQLTLNAIDEDGNPYTAEWPVSPADEGKPSSRTQVRVGGGAAAAQARLDALVRREFDWLNRDYTVQWPVSGLAGLFFRLLDRVTLTYAGTLANGVHFNWEQKPFWIHKMVMTPGPAYTGQTVFTLEEEPELSAAP